MSYLTNTEKCFLMHIKRLKKQVLTTQQYKVLKGQVLAGDTVGAQKGLQKLLQMRNIKRDGGVAC